MVLDLKPAAPLDGVRIGAAGSWQQELSPRHAELLCVLAMHRDGRTAAELADDVFGDRTRTVTVRAEMSRVRRNLAGVLAHRPYRFREEVAVEVLRPELPADLLPHSLAPHDPGGDHSLNGHTHVGRSAAVHMADGCAPTASGVPAPTPDRPGNSPLRMMR